MNPILKVLYLKLKYKIVPSKEQRFWAQELVNSPGLGSKLGQVLSQGKSVELPPPSISIDEARKLFKENFDTEISIKSEGIAASMGQVFKIEINDKTYAIKILHPKIKEKILKELDNVLLLGKFYSRKSRFKFDTNSFRRLLTTIFDDETNLRTEAISQEIAYDSLKTKENIKIPFIVPEFSNSNILTQEWVDSTLAKDLKALDSDDILDFFFFTLMSENRLHGDLNDRNWGIHSTGKTVVMDYGCYRIVTDRRIEGFKKLILNQDVENAFAEFGVRLAASTLKGREQELRDDLFGPLFDKVIFPDLKYGEKLREKYGDAIKELREFTDPWVLLLMRSLFSVLSTYQRLGREVDLKSITSTYLVPSQTFDTSLGLFIEVTQDGKQKAFIQLPLSALRDLPSHIPESVPEEKVKSVFLQLKEKGEITQSLFDEIHESKRYRIWIGEV